MAVRVLVMSPLHNLGQTVCSTLFAQGVTFSGKSSMLLASSAKTPIPEYLGLEANNDPTRSVMQIVKLIDAGSISDQDILDYAHQYTKNGYYLNMTDNALVGKDRSQVLRHLFERTPCDIVVCDNSADISDPETEALLELADAIFIVVDMSPKSLKYLESWSKSKQLQNYSNVFLIVNKYDEVISSMRDFTKKTPYTNNRLCKIHYNPWISKCCFNGQLATILPLSKEFDPRVANLAVDVDDIYRCCASIDIMKIKKGF